MSDNDALVEMLANVLKHGAAINRAKGDTR